MRPLRLALLLLFAAWFPGGPGWGAEAPLRAGWYAAQPQQYLRQGELTGLDIEMVRAIAARAGQPVQFSAMGFAALLEAVATGQADLITGIVATEARAGRFHLSRAYRRDTNVLIVRRGEASRLRFTDVAGLAAHVTGGHGFRLGVRTGYSYFNAMLDAWIAAPARPELVRASDDDQGNIRRLLAGEIDGFLAERLSVALAITAVGAGAAVEEQAMRLYVPLHLAFAPTVSPATVAAFDAAIVALEAEGVLDRIAGRFRFPLLLSQTLDSRWYRTVTVLSTIASALAGVLAARQSGWSLFGALVLATVTATAGGVLRDLLVGRFPITIAREPRHLLLVIGVVLSCWAIAHLWALLRGRAMLAFWIAQATVALRRRRIDRWVFDAADAFGLGASTVLGVAVALGTQAEPLWLWGPILGTITGAGGGILRDVLRGGGNIPNLKTGFYGEVALLWSLALSAWLILRGPTIELDEVVVAVTATIIGAAATRLAAVAWGWKPPRLG